MLTPDLLSPSFGVVILPRAFFTILALPLLWIAWTVVYNLYFHPLSRFPGPKLWATFRIPYVVSLLSGNLGHDERSFHERYGNAVRTAPNEISFVDPRAWNDIFARRPNHDYFPKNPVWWDSIPGVPNSLVNLGEADHARMRRMLAPGFSDKALRAQEPIVQQYVDTFIRKIRDMVNNGGGESTVPIVRWYHYLFFDITGDLGFGQSFDCLEEGKYHEWIEGLFRSLKAYAFVAALRFYPSLWKILFLLLPNSLMDDQRKHYQFVIDRVQRRLQAKTEREDLMSHLLTENEDKKMTDSEVEANFNIIIIAGSETTATAMTGITNYLIKSPLAYDKLVAEIRTMFKAEEEMTFSSLQKATYLNAVIDEGMRMAPSVATGAPRLVPEGGDYVCGHWLPGGTNVVVPQWSVFRSPRNFWRPNEFIPERWLNLEESAPFATDKKFAFQPFSYGPTQCIGKNLAYAKMRLTLARLLWNFDISAIPGPESIYDWEQLKMYVSVETKPFDVRLVLAR